VVSSTSLMFLGYNLYDWELRVLMHGLVNNVSRRLKFKHVAVQLEASAVRATDSATVQTFLQQYFLGAKIDVYWGSTMQFVAELREALGEE